MKRLTKGFLSFIMMAAYALGMGAQDATVVPADEIPSSLRDAASLKLTGTWGTSAFCRIEDGIGDECYWRFQYGADPSGYGRSRD